MGLLAARGHELTPHPEQADVLVVNTCSFIDPAKRESVDTILEMAEFKKTGRARRLIVAGCLVERYRGDIRADLPEVDAVVGPTRSSASCPFARAARRRRARLRRTSITTSPRGCWPRRATSPHQDRGGLRSSVHVLRDSAVPGPLPQPAFRVGDIGSRGAVRAGGCGRST